MKYIKRLLSALLAVSAAALPAISGAEAAATHVPHAVISGLPLNFEPTALHAGDGAEFVAHGPKYAIALDEKGAALALGSDVIRLQVLGARAAEPTAEQPLKVWLAGDSLMGNISQSFIEATAGTPLISASQDFQIGTGLAR